MAEDNTPAQQSTEVRPPAGKRAGPDTTLQLGPSSRNHNPPSRLRPRLHRWLIVGAVVTGIVLVLWWRSTEDLHAPTESPSVDEPPPETARSETDSDYQRRLQLLGVQPATALSEAEKEQRISFLFGAFEAALAADNLLLPAVDSASEYLLQMTALDHEHPKVLEARSLLARSFLENAREARGAGRWEEADRMLQHALDVRLAPGVRPAESQEP